MLNIEFLLDKEQIRYVKQTDRQTHRQIDGQIDGQKDRLDRLHKQMQTDRLHRQTDRQIDWTDYTNRYKQTQIDTHRYKQIDYTDRQIDRQIDRTINIQINRQIERQINRWADGQMER